MNIKGVFIRDFLALQLLLFSGCGVGRKEGQITSRNTPNIVNQKH